MKRSGLKASKDFLLVSQPPQCVPSAANMVTSQGHVVLKLICFLILHLCWKVSYYHNWLEFLKCRCSVHVFVALQTMPPKINQGEVPFALIQMPLFEVHEQAGYVVNLWITYDSLTWYGFFLVPSRW